MTNRDDCTYQKEGNGDKKFCFAPSRRYASTCLDIGEGNLYHFCEPDCLSITADLSQVMPLELSLYLKQVVNRLLNLLLSPLQILSQVQNLLQNQVPNQVLNQRRNQPTPSLSQWESQCFNLFLIFPCLIISSG